VVAVVRIDDPAVAREALAGPEIEPDAEGTRFVRASAITWV
jgi:hypothetical protein